MSGNNNNQKPVAQPDAIQNPTQRYSKLAVASLVCGVGAFVSLFLGMPFLNFPEPVTGPLLLLLSIVLCVLALVFGFWGLYVITRNKSGYKGFGRCTAGLIIALVYILFVVVFVLPAITRMRSGALTVQCLVKLRTISDAMYHYAKDNNGRLPSKQSWCDDLMDYGVKKEDFICPDSKSNIDCSYSMNENISGMLLSELDPNTVLVFESNGGWNSFGTAAMATKDNHEGVGFNILYAGGHVRFETDVNDLVWDMPVKKTAQPPTIRDEDHQNIISPTPEVIIPEVKNHKPETPQPEPPNAVIPETVQARIFTGTGTVKHIKLEGGFWAIVGDDGKRFNPRGLPADFRTDGLRVRYKLKEKPRAMSIQMFGIIVKVRSIERL